MQSFFTSFSTTNNTTHTHTHTLHAMNITQKYKITILSNGVHASIARKCADLREAMVYSIRLAMFHYVEEYATRFIEDEHGNMLAVYNPATNTWNIIEDEHGNNPATNTWNIIEH